MMDEKSPTSFLTVLEGRQGRYEEKKSVFLGDLKHVDSEEEAQAFIDGIRKKYYDARHHCFAWRIGKNKPAERASDDGEPSGTAGKPILEVLAGAGVTDAVLVVTRYFGGTLLGTGGLVRAYTAAAGDCVKKSRLIRKTWGVRIRLDVPYGDLGKMQYMLAQDGIPVLSSTYTDSVCMEVILPAGSEEELKKKLMDCSAGRVRPEQMDFTWYAEADGQIRLG